MVNKNLYVKLVVSLNNQYSIPGDIPIEKYVRQSFGSCATIEETEDEWLLTVTISTRKNNKTTIKTLQRLQMFLKRYDSLDPHFVAKE